MLRRLTIALGISTLASFGCGPGVVIGADDDSGSDSTTGDGCVATGDELCDGLDNDCDGAVDEGIGPLTCGLGACQMVVTCQDGAMPACVPGEPQPEVCNLDDDDCDGEVDEDLGFGPLAPAQVVRLDEFATGSCTSCAWAWGTTLAPAPAGPGFMVLWNLGLDGGNEQPTMFGRPLDPLGISAGPVALQRTDFFTDFDPFPTLDPPPPLGVPILVEHRLQNRGDHAGLLFAAGDGSTSLVSPIVGQGPQNVDRIVWTGARFVTAWEQDDALQVAILHADGALDHMVEVDPLDRPGHITLGVYPGRVGIMVSRVRIDQELWDQWFITLDASGEVLVPAHPVDLEYATWQRVVGTQEGWLRVRPYGTDDLTTRQPLDVAGDPLDIEQAFTDLRQIGGSPYSDTFVPRPGLGEMASAWADPNGGDMHVEFLDDRGEVLRDWSGPLDPDPGSEVGYLVDPHIQFVDGHLLVAWHGLADNQQPNPVYVRPFGCP